MIKGLKKAIGKAIGDVGARGVNLGMLSRIPHADISPSSYPDCKGMRGYEDVVREEIENYIASGGIDMYCAGAMDNSIDSRTLEELRSNDKAYIDRRGSARILVAEREAALHDVGRILAGCEEAEAKAVAEVDEIEARIAELDEAFNSIKRRVVSIVRRPRPEARAEDEYQEAKGA